MIELSKDECAAVYEVIDQLSGGNPEYTFLHSCGEIDDPESPHSTAFAKIFRAVGASIPPNLESVV